MPNQNAPTSVGEEAMSLFVGKNYEYFKRKWEIAEGKKNKQSWNLAAFIFGFSWMAYRKMYLYSWVFIGVVMVELLCEFAFALPDRMSNAINIAIAISFGKFGNYLYKHHAEKKIKEICALSAPDQVDKELRSHGGTNIVAALGFVAAFVAIMILVSVVANQRQELSENEANNAVSAQASLIEAQPPTTPAISAPVDTNPSLIQRAVEPISPQAIEAAQSVSLPASTGNFAPSFDCAKASTVPERLICSSQVLSEFDVQLAQDYKRLLDISPDKVSIRKEQRDWIKTQLNKCSTVDCIETAYKSRIDDLEAITQYLLKPEQFR